VEYDILILILFNLGPPYEYVNMYSTRRTPRLRLRHEAATLLDNNNNKNWMEMEGLARCDVNPVTGVVTVIDAIEVSVSAARQATEATNIITINRTITITITIICDT